jgi:hypothetical protein
VIRYFLAMGDHASNAVITQGLDSVTYSNPPPSVQIATLGMKTYCTACKQEGYIAPRGPRWPGTGPNGKQWALSGDINICGCNPSPVFYAERGMTMIFTADEAAALMRSTGKSANSQTGAYDQGFRVVNPHTRQPLRDTPYRIITGDGEEIEGRTDSQGYTQRVAKDQAMAATLYVFEGEPPLNPDWDKYL